MSWIEEIDEDDADQDLKEIYEEVKGDRGKISNILKVHSVNPNVLEAHMDFYMEIMFRSSSLSREEAEFIAVIVSSVNECEYCINHHAEALNHYWKDKERIENLKNDFRSLDLTEKQLRMAEYTEKLTKNPNTITQKKISQLREAGLKDREIHDINVIIGYFNFVNRVALGLGVEFTPEEIKGYNY